MSFVIHPLNSVTPAYSPGTAWVESGTNRGRDVAALGFDDARSRWRSLASVDAADLAADGRLDAVLDERVQEAYGERFGVLKTA
ncbi:MAG: hypothetical protein ABEJ61_08280 [Haloferacaceae archaeon]